MALAPLLVWMALAIGAAATAAASLNRPADPVVLTGAALPSLQGTAPSKLLAWRYSGGWQQVPVQVDERALVDLAKPYNNAPTGVSVPMYTDAGTYTGPDPDPTFDAGDELAFMARDAGAKAPPASEPPNALAGSGVELRVTDPLDSGEGYVYLFVQKGNLDPGAGQQYVNYSFALLGGQYPQNYNLSNGPNPENSVVTTPYYSHHFSDRWIDDQLKVTAGSASGADILDRHTFGFAPGNCLRSEDTFSSGEGNFVINKSGPVRAIRSYMGANSGPYTQREHVFYDRRQDLRTFLRVHAIAGAMDLFDYSPAAAGMTYKHDVDQHGVTIDGAPDTVTGGQIRWETVDGVQGGLEMVYEASTDMPDPSYTSYYLDKLNPGSSDAGRCTGDGKAYGVSGPWINHGIPSTDPANGGVNRYESTRHIFYEAPGQTNGPARRAELDSSLSVTAARVEAYPRPASAPQLSVSLVPVFRQCGTGANPPNGAHSAPLSVGACLPPATLGIAHVGGQAVASATLTVVPGNPGTPQDEADVSINSSATDVRTSGPNGPDYDPSPGGADLTLITKLRLTDYANGGSAAEPGTATDLDFAVPVVCAATAGSEGAACALGTSADAVTPGAISESKSTVAQAFRVRLNDSGQNGVRGDGDDRLFEQQGFLVP